MTEQMTLLQQECCKVWGEAGLAEMEAHCVANSMTLEQYIEAIVHRPGGACDRHGINVDEMPAERIAKTLRAARIVTDMQETTRVLLRGPHIFNNPGEGC